jgi:hypothetical protein
MQIAADAQEPAFKVRMKLIAIPIHDNHWIMVLMRSSRFEANSSSRDAIVPREDFMAEGSKKQPRQH